jgi:hypothetical protein
MILDSLLVHFGWLRTPYNAMQCNAFVIVVLAPILYWIWPASLLAFAFWIMAHHFVFYIIYYLTQQGADMTLFPRILKFVYYIAIVSAFCCNMTVVAHTTALNVLGAGMALRGPDGSMMTATDGMYEERNTVFTTFGWGLACTVGSVVLCVWLILSWEAAIVCMVIAIYGCRIIWKNYQRAARRFDFDESQTVDFRDIMEGPAAIQAIPWTASNNNNNNHRGGNHRGNQQQQQMHNNKGALKKSESMPVTMQDDGPYSNMDGPYSDMEARMNTPANRYSNNSSNNDIHKRRGTPVDSKESFIQTV